MQYKIRVIIFVLLTSPNQAFGNEESELYRDNKINFSIGATERIGLTLFSVCFDAYQAKYNEIFVGTSIILPSFSIGLKHYYNDYFISPFTTLNYVISENYSGSIASNVNLCLGVDISIFNLFSINTGINKRYNFTNEITPYWAPVIAIDVRF